MSPCTPAIAALVVRTTAVDRESAAAAVKLARSTAPGAKSIIDCVDVAGRCRPEGDGFEATRSFGC